MIFHTGDVLRNCIKIQYYTSAFCYFFMYYNHQQDTQDAVKLVLPASGGDRGGRQFQNNNRGSVISKQQQGSVIPKTQSSTLWNPSPVSPKEGEAVCLLAEKAY